MSLAQRLGFDPDDRVLILHADDVGSSHAANTAAFECLEEGSLTSGSVIVPAAWFREAAAYAREHPEADLGVHLTLTSEYADTDMVGVIEDTLALYRKVGREWEEIGARIGETYTLDIENNLLTAYLVGTSRFGEMTVRINLRPLFLPLVVRNG